MRLEELFLDGFGRFHEQTIGISGPVTVFYGPNEAGKSTMLAFVRAVLFGFPARGRNEHYPPLAGGRHGGRIRFSDDGGAVYTLERFAGARGGSATLVTGAEEPLDVATTLPRLTGQATPDLFKNVFAFSLDELQREGLMNDSGISDRIYGAGLGVTRLPEFTKMLSDRKEDIFRPRGRSQIIAKLLDELESVDQQLQAVLGNADEYRHLAGRQDEILRELAETSAEVSRLNARRSEIDSLLSGWDDWLALADCEARLQEMPRFEQFPEDPITRLENFQGRARQAVEDRDEAAEQLRLSGEAASVVIPGENLLEDAGKIEAIRRDRGSFDSSVRDLPKRQEELLGMEESLSANIRALDEGWDESHLDAVDTSMATHEQVEQSRRQLDACSQNAGDAQVRLEQDHSRLEELRAEEQEAQARLRAGPDGQGGSGLHPASGRLEELLEDREPLEQIRRGRSSFDNSVRDLPERRAELDALESGLGDRLRDLGQGWDEARLVTFDTSMVFRQEVGLRKGTLAAQSDAVRRAQQRLERENAGLTERQAAAWEAEERLPADPPPLDAAGLERQQDVLRTARGRLDTYERARLNHDNLRGQLSSLTGDAESPDPATGRSSPLLPALLALAGVILIVAGVSLGGNALLLGLIGGLAPLGAAIYLLARRRAAPAPVSNLLSGALARQSAEAATSVEEALRLLVEAALPLGIDVHPTTAELSSTEARLVSAATALSAWNEANDRAGETQRLLKSQEQRVEEAMQQREAAAVSEGEALQEWQDWLRQRWVPSSFTPDTVIEFMGSVETARAVLNQVHQMRRRVSAIEVDTGEYLALVQPVAVKHGVALDGSDHQRTMAVTDALIENFDRVQHLVTQRDDVARRLKQQEQTADATADEQRNATEVLSETQSQWRHWLRVRGLRNSLTPDTMLEFLARVETARTALGEARGMRNRVAAIEYEIDEFRQQVEPLAAALVIPLDPGDRRQLATVADDLIKGLEEARTGFSHRERAKEQQEENRRLSERREQRLQSVRQELTALLEAGGADDPEEFRTRARRHGERQELERKRDEHLRSLERLSGPGGQFQAFRESLTAADPNRLREESGRLLEQATEADAGRNKLLEERGGIDYELTQLTSEEESSALRIRRNTLLEQLQEQARRWSRLTIAESLLEKTRHKFERERQPSVIRHAQDFFSTVTGQRYTGLFAPLGEQTISVTDATGGSRQPSELSRGTREQLYLALRFGLIREFGEHAERLPVIVDEALVNFDPERARLAAESFAGLSETNQVLVFTCHPATADMFADAAGAQVVDISPWSC